MAREDAKQRQAARERCEQILRAYGADADAWPPEERAELEALLHDSAELRQLARQEASLDQWLDAAADLEPSAALHGRILDAVPRPSEPLADRLDRWAAELWNGWRRWPAVAALAAATVLGVGTGLVSPGSDTSGADTESATEGESIASNEGAAFEEFGFDEFVLDDYADDGALP